MGESMKFTDLDQYLFGQGTNYEVYKKLGAHPTTYRRKKRIFCGLGTKCPVSICNW